MAKLINEGDTIIAQHTDGHSRKIEWKGLRKHPVTKKSMTLYECDRNSFAEIVCSCSDNIEPGTESYCRDIGDQLQADAISIYVDSIRKEKFEVKEGISGRHGSQLFRFRKKCISTIKTPLAIFAKHLMAISSKDHKEIKN